MPMMGQKFDGMMSAEHGKGKQSKWNRFNKLAGCWHWECEAEKEQHSANHLTMNDRYIPTETNRSNKHIYTPCAVCSHWCMRLQKHSKQQPHK